MLSEKVQEVLETLWIEIFEQKKVPDISVLKDSETLKELLEKGYLSQKLKYLLTEKGAEEGALCVRRHRLAERLLADVLKVKSGLVHEASCKFEHGLQKGIEDNICILLGHPKTCPHGSKIPPGKCCKEKKKESKSAALPLSELKGGQHGRIAYIHADDKVLLQKIIAMGALPGQKITLIHRFPSFVFQIGEGQFAVDKTIADQIHVWVMG